VNIKRDILGFQKRLVRFGTRGNFFSVFIHHLVILPEAIGGMACVAHEVYFSWVVTSESSVIHVWQFA
jgi:hypothetical protein